MRVGSTAVLILSAWLLPLPGTAQLSPGDIAERESWELFLRSAEVVAREQLSGEGAVTNPKKLTLRAGGREACALWKGVDGKPLGVLDCWRFEVAAYLLDKHLGLGMVPPTVERADEARPGSCQLWVGGVKTLRDRLTEPVERTDEILLNWRRAGYLQQAFDNLIGNADRNQGNILVGPGWRWVLIDHSRAFRAENRLFFTEEAQPDQFMRALPRAFVEKVRALNADAVGAAVGGHLKKKEIAAVMARRKLLLHEIDRIIRRDGEAAVLY